jgi:hypothetical protein
MATQKETAEKTYFGFGTQEKDYQKRALEALPILVRQAKSKQTIYYSDLARELNMPNPRNLNYVLGAIGNELLMLGEKWGIKIPPLQCLVVNKNLELPGEGIDYFLTDKIDFKNKTNQQRRILIQLLLDDVFSFDRWNQVLSNYGLTEAKSNYFIRNKEIIYSHSYGKGGESNEHKELKDYVLNNPSVIGIKSRIDGVIEYPLPTHDTIDIVFKGKDEIIGVEVKSIISDDNDIIRGMFQCIKYQVLLEAEQKIQGNQVNIRIVLAIAGVLNKDLTEIKNTLGIEVIENITNKA